MVQAARKVLGCCSMEPKVFGTWLFEVQPVGGWQMADLRNFRPSEMR